GGGGRVGGGGVEEPHRAGGIAAPGAHPAPDEQSHVTNGYGRFLVVGQVCVGEAERAACVPGHDEKLAAWLEIPGTGRPVVPRGDRVGGIQRGGRGSVVTGQLFSGRQV